MIGRHADTLLALGLAVAMFLSAGRCSGPDRRDRPAAAEPDRVVVQHVLVSFAGKLPGQSVRRTEEEARRLASEILARAESGEEFEALVKEYSDDRHPGIYGMANRGVVPNGENEYRREDMVPGFGDVAFGLAPDGVGLCAFDAVNSPFGFHVIKRLR